MLNRRAFLGAAITSLLAVSGLVWLRRRWPYLSLWSKDKRVLVALVDTLVPTDESPGAIDLGVHERLLDAARNSSQLRRQLRVGAQWLNQSAQRAFEDHFGELDLERREQIVAQLVEAGEQDGFFRSVRSFVMRDYYAHAEVFASLHYSGPPQPAGFMDYTQPPGGDTN